MGGFAFRSQPHEQPADLRGGRLAAHHGAEHLGSLIFGERLAVGERAQRAAQRRIHGGLRLSPLSNSDNELHLSPVTGRPFLAVIQYDGGGFTGWQRQPVDRTVQAEFEAVLERLMGRKTVATGAGRTDAGVHALGQGVSFLGAERWTAQPADLRRALNALLPREIWVQQVHLMRPGFDARRSATARRYRYLIGTDEAARSPFRRPYEWALGRPLDLGLLQAAALALVGEHDFRGLAAAGAATAHYRCRVALAEWAPRADGAGMT